MQNAKEDAGHRQWISVERWLQYKGLRHTNDQRLVVMVGGRLHIGGQIIIGRGWHHDKSMRVSSLILQRLNQKNNEDCVVSCHVTWGLGSTNRKQTSKLKSMQTMKWEIQILYSKTIVVSDWILRQLMAINDWSEAIVSGELVEI